MSIWQIIQRLVPFVKAYTKWVVISLTLDQEIFNASARSLNIDRISPDYRTLRDE